MRRYKVGIVGAPNVGKTSIFNSLSKAKEKVGNWAGTTIERIEKKIKIPGKEITLIDVPGIYSLSATSTDEKVAKDFILNEHPDLLIVVVNSVNLYNSLFLATELLELGFRIIIALNMYDIAKKNRIKIDLPKLSEIFGVKVIPTVGNNPAGVEELRKEIIHEIERSEKEKTKSNLYIHYPQPIEKGIARIMDHLSKKKISPTYTTRGIAIKLLEGSGDIIPSVTSTDTLDKLREIAREITKELRESLGDDIDTAIIKAKYHFIDKVLKECVERPATKNEIIRKKIDQILTNKIGGAIVFLVVMFSIFQLVFLVGDPLASIIEEGFSALSNWIYSEGRNIKCNDTLISFLTNGLISGVGSVLTLLPYISLLFLFISILENSGFLARSTIVMDRVMTFFGLHGKSFLPILIGLGCNVPGIMATRVLSNFKDRLITTLVLPLIPCPARFTVLVVVCASLFKEHQAIILFSMYLMNMALAGIFGMIFRKYIAKDEYSLFAMELPEFRLPSLRVVLSEAWYRSLLFVKKAGTVILLVVIIVWLLGSLPFGVEYSSEKSLLGTIGKTLQPIFIPTGFGQHWQVVVSIFSAFSAREAVIGTLGTLYSVSEKGITEVLPTVFTPLSALSFLIFMQIATLCIPTVIVTANEVGKKWAVFSFFYTFLIAWCLSTITYNLGTLIFGN
ncbi:MAG: ferrous iron transport protein B [Brevinematia bacterium]